MLVRITRDAVRRAVRKACPIYNDWQSTSSTDPSYKEKRNAYCNTCIISDTVFNKLPDSVKPAVTIHTDDGCTQLIRLYDEKRYTLGIGHYIKNIISTFDRGIRNTHNADAIYRSLRYHDLLNLELEDFPTNGWLPKVEVGYKKVSYDFYSCMDNNPNKVKYEIGKWTLPKLVGSKLFVLPKGEYNMTNLHLFKCLMVNPVKAKARCWAGDFHFQNEFWSEYDVSKGSNDYSVPTVNISDEVYFADAVKLLERVT